MSRLQTKCAFASGVAHALLFVLIIVGSAFVKPPPKPDAVHIVHIFDASKITDDETQGGGNPNVPSDATPPAPLPPTVVQQPLAQPVEPPVRIPEPVKKVEPPPAPTPKPKREVKAEPPPEAKKETVKPEPVKKETAKIVKNDKGRKIVPKERLTEKPVETPHVEPPKPKHQVEVNLDVVKKATPDPEIERLRQQRQREIKEAKEREEAARREEARAQMLAIDQANRERKQLLAAVSGVVGNVQTGLARTTNVEMPGPGGEAFINYADLIYATYYQAWQTPEGRDVRTPVKVEIVVARDGRVLSSTVIRSSGDAQLDRSVRQALDRVTKLKAFPEGAKDLQRTFRISFELKSKRQFG
jgi:TonB family protein